MVLDKKERLVWDIEANGLLEDSTRIWCLAYKNIDTGETGGFVIPEPTKRQIIQLFADKVLIGHNIIKYDIPMLSKFYQLDVIGLFGKESIIDTYLWSQILYPDRPMPKGCPESIHNPITHRSHKIGPHGLESWGYRTGRKKIEIHDWTKYDESILKRCMEDVEINVDTYFKLLKEAGMT